MEQPKIINSILRVILVAGMLILAVFAFVGVTKIVPKAFTSLGSAFSSVSSSLFSPKENIVISLSNNSVKSGEPVDVSFDHKNKTAAGTYEFKFDCTDKNLSMILIDGSIQKNVSCYATSTVSTNPFRIIPQLKNQNSFVDSYVYVTFYNKETGSRQAVGKTVLTINNGTLNSTQNQIASTTQQSSAASTSTSATKNTTSQRATGNTHAFSGIQKSDLYVVPKDMGIVTNGVFIPRTNFANYESPVIRFDIGNDGNVETGPWQFTAALPTYPSQLLPSGIQPSLKPGELIEYTLSLQNLAYSGNNVVTINVDSTQSVSELSETNNVTTMTLVNNGSAYNGNNNYYNNNNYYTGSDLMLRILAKGYIDRNTGQFYESSSVSRNNRVAVRFEIENTGTGQTGPFIFTGNISGNSSDTYTSPTQSSFYPGEKRQYTIDFGAYNTGQSTVTIRLDTNNTVNETNESNNALSTDVIVY